MRKLITILLLTVIGLSIASYASAQIPWTRTTTLYRRGDNASFGGTSIGFVLSPTVMPGSNSSNTRLLIYSINVLNLNTTDNTLIIYANNTTYAAATVGGRQEQRIGQVTFLTSTTYVQGDHLPKGTPINGASLGIGAAYAGDVGAVFDCTTEDGKPLNSGGIIFKPTNQAAGVAGVFTVAVTYRTE